MHIPACSTNDTASTSARSTGRKQPQAKWVPCRLCKGTGRIQPDGFFNTTDEPERCDHCEGFGQVARVPRGYALYTVVFRCGCEKHEQLLRLNTAEEELAEAKERPCSWGCYTPEERAKHLRWWNHEFGDGPDGQRCESGDCSERNFPRVQPEAARASREEFGEVLCPSCQSRRRGETKRAEIQERFGVRRAA